MPFFFLAILLLSSRVANCGPLNFGVSTFSVPDDFSLVDDGKTIDNGKVTELPLDLSQSNQFAAFSNQEANGLPDPQIPGSANDASPNLLVDLPTAVCSDSEIQVKGSAQKIENVCPAPASLVTPPSRQSTEQEERQQQDSGINPNPEEKKKDGSLMDPIPPDDICPPPKKLFCCFGREIENWNSREACEQCMLPFYIPLFKPAKPMKIEAGILYGNGGSGGPNVICGWIWLLNCVVVTTLRECHMQGGFPFCCMVVVGVLVCSHSPSFTPSFLFK